MSIVTKESNPELYNALFLDDEIKEILDIERYRNKDGYVCNINLTPDEIHKLLDYITNLRQEKDYYFKKNNELSTLNTSLRSDRDNYKKRIEKANEFIKNTPLYEITYDYNMEDELEIQNVSDETASNKLLNILDGKE